MWRALRQKISSAAGREKMAETKLSIPEIVLIATTRVALGIGIGLLFSGKLSRDQRKAAGLALALVGGITTIPLALRVSNLRKEGKREMLPAA
jgi:hypothetical protein